MTPPLSLYTTELSHRVLYSLFALGLTFCVTYTYADVFLYWYVHPCATTFLCTTMTEAFFLSLQVALYTAVYLWIPYIAYTLWAFLSPSLFAFEKKKWGWTFVFGIFFLYVSGLGAALFVVPMVTRVLFEAAHTGSLVTLDMDPRISSYMQVCFSLYLVGHICTLVPFGLVLCRVQVHRRWLYLICLFGVAFTCPPDPSMQFFCTLCAFVGAEFCVILSTLTRAYAAVTLSFGEEAAAEIFGYAPWVIDTTLF